MKTEKTDRYLCIVHDVDGLPRAWGSATTKDAAKVEAERQWTQRLEKRAAEGTTDRSEERGETTVEVCRAGAQHTEKVS